jgi:broad specificity phosphatase PhoE/ribonuclease HI
MSRRLIVEADGGSRGNPGPAGYGAVVRDAGTGEVLAERAAGIGVATNNVAEYGGLIAGLRAALDLDPSEVEVRLDSKLLVEQMSGRWQVKNPGIKPLAREAAGLISQLPPVRFVWVPREQNKHADRLANEAMDAAARGDVWKQDAAAVFLEQAAAVPNRLSGWQDGPSAPTTTLLLRHGQTELSVEKRFSGSGDQPLTETGRAQAAAAAARLASSGAVAVVSSPLRRARETALLVAAGLGLEVAFDGDFRETDFGDWEGFTFREVRDKWPRELDAWLGSTAVAPPFGESFDATAARVRLARDRVLSSYGGQTVVVVSHVTPIKTLLRMALDAPPAALYRIHLDLASLNDVRWHADGPAVVHSMNDVGHLST